MITHIRSMGESQWCKEVQSAAKLREMNQLGASGFRCKCWLFPYEFVCQRLKIWKMGSI